MSDWAEEGAKFSTTDGDKVGASASTSAVTSDGASLFIASVICNFRKMYFVTVDFMYTRYAKNNTYAFP